MKSSLPQIFNKDLYQISLPRKQSPEYSLFLRTNNFTLKNTNQNSLRYNNNDSNQRINKSMDILSGQRKTFSLKKQSQTQNGLKSLLTQRKKAHSRSFFIEQKQNQTAQQIDSFKTIRKRVMEELILLQKSLTIINRSQNSIKQGFKSFKSYQLTNLQDFQYEMKRSINQLRNSFKQLRKQTNTELKVNKQQALFLQQQANNLKVILQGFTQQSNRLSNQIIDEKSVSKS